VFDSNPSQPCSTHDGTIIDPLDGAVGLAFKASVVDLLGDESTNIRVHSPASIEEQAEMTWHRGLAAENMVEP